MRLCIILVLGDLYLKSLVLEDNPPVHNHLLARILIPSFRLLVWQLLTLHFAGPKFVRCAVACTFRHSRILLPHNEFSYDPDHGPEERHVCNVDGDRGFAQIPEGVDDVVKVLGKEGKGLGHNAGDDLSWLVYEMGFVLSRWVVYEEKLETYNKKTHAKE